MSIKILDVETLARQRLIETDPNFWSSDELTQMIIAGVKDLWRDIVDLKQEHFLTFNSTDVSYQSQSTELSGIPKDVHKVYMIEARDLSTNGDNHGLQFLPLDYNHRDFQLARSRDAVAPVNDTIYYSITAQGAPVGAPIIKVAPKITSAVNLNFVYVPVLTALTKDSFVPIPGEADNALVAWTVAFARAKEDENRSPDASWLAIYATEKQHLLQSLGLRQYQEPLLTDAMFDQYW